MEILIIDDNPVNIQVLGGILGREGYDIAACTSGDQALKYLHDHLPELILLDVLMPGLDGFETCRRIKSDPRTKSLPVIFLTAQSHTKDIVHGFQAGALDYVSKPFEPDELLARVKTHISLKQAHEEITELRQLIPLCAWCRKIRRPDNTWETVEQYLAENSRSMVTHGICPECSAKF